MKNDDRVGIADFKAHLSEHLRTVRKGQPLTLMNRDTPVARLVPYELGGEKLVPRKASRTWKEIRLPPPLGRPIDSLEALLEERRDRS